MNKLIQRSFLNALATVAYVTIVAAILQGGNKIFNQKDTFTTPIAALTLLVTSAAITGGLVLGKPVLMYLENQKKDAIKLFMYTVGWLALATIILLMTNLKGL